MQGHTDDATETHRTTTDGRDDRSAPAAARISRRGLLAAAGTAGAAATSACLGGLPAGDRGGGSGRSNDQTTTTSFDERPNVVQILADDLGWSDIGAYQELVPEADRPRGFGFYESPRIDRLAGEGALFTDAYAASPVCSPTRASLYTGQYTPRHGVTSWIKLRPKRLSGPRGKQGKLIEAKNADSIPPDAQTTARLLGQAGYRTAHVGKWHLTRRGKGVLPGDLGYDLNVAGGHWGAPPMGYFCGAPLNGPYNQRLRNLDCPQGEYLTRVLTDEAIDWMEADDEPFFLDLAYHSVHKPIEAPRNVVQEFENKRQEMGLPKRDVMRNNTRVVQSDPTYAAMVRELDRGIGRVLDAVDRLDRPTIVIFHSDNGGFSSGGGGRKPTSSLPLERGKGFPYEGGIRVPTIIRWPGLTDGETIRTPVITMDCYATALAAAGVDLPDPSIHPVDGVDLEPLLAGGSIQDRALYFHFPHYWNLAGPTPAGAIRYGEFKLIEFFEDGHTELFNVAENLAEDVELSRAAPEREKRLHERLNQWQADLDVEFPEENPNFSGSASPGGYYERQPTETPLADP